MHTVYIVWKHATLGSIKHSIDDHIMGMFASVVDAIEFRESLEADEQNRNLRFSIITRKYD